MSTPSSRPTKRRKLGSDHVTPAASPSALREERAVRSSARCSSKPLVTYSTRRRRVLLSQKDTFDDVDTENIDPDPQFADPTAEGGIGHVERAFDDEAPSKRTRGQLSRKERAADDFQDQKKTQSGRGRITSTATKEHPGQEEGTPNVNQGSAEIDGVGAGAQSIKGACTLPTDHGWDVQDTILVETPTIRSSGRQRKQTPKVIERLAEVVERKGITPQSVHSKAQDTKAMDPGAVVPLEVVTAGSKGIPTTPSGRKRGRPRKIDSVGPDPHVEDVAMHDNTPSRKSRAWKLRDEAMEDGLVLSTSSSNAEPWTPTTPSKKKAQIPSKLDSPPGKLLEAPSPLGQREVNGTQKALRHLHSVLQESRFEMPFQTLKAAILEGLRGKRRLPLLGLDEEYQKVRQLVEQTIVAGEGNSMLLIGARGSAKSLLVNHVLSEMAVEHPQDFHVVRLNGFIHTDDKLALKEIWRQLGEEMDIDDEGMAARGNYADTLASLLALFSQPDELIDAESTINQTSKSVLFILDEFELFASHPRQTLLYNLFDIAQSRKAPIVVLGLTTRIDVVESLEKRVKSRFSHRYVHLQLPKSFAAFRDICASALAGNSDGNDTFEIRLPGDGPKASITDTEVLQTAWTEYVRAVVENEASVCALLRRIYASSRSVPTFLSACLIPIASMERMKIPTATDFTAHCLLPPDSKLDLLSGLSEIELSLLIAAARLDIILDTDSCNFNMAYDEYTTLGNRLRIQTSASGATAVGAGSRVWGREVALGAWERLESLGLLVPMMSGSGTGGMSDVGRAGRLFKVDVALEEIGANGLEMSSTMARWCREI